MTAPGTSGSSAAPHPDPAWASWNPRSTVPVPPLSSRAAVSRKYWDALRERTNYLQQELATAQQRSAARDQAHSDQMDAAIKALADARTDFQGLTAKYDKALKDLQAAQASGPAAPAAPAVTRSAKLPGALLDAAARIVADHRGNLVGDQALALMQVDGVAGYTNEIYTAAIASVRTTDYVNQNKENWKKAPAASNAPVWRQRLSAVVGGAAYDIDRVNREMRQYLESLSSPNALGAIDDAWFIQAREEGLN